MRFEYLTDSERLKVSPENNTELRAIKGWLTRKKDGYMFDTRFKLKLWDGNETEWNREDSTIPLGLWREAFKCCNELGYMFDFVNKKDFPINRSVNIDELKAFYDDFFKDHIDADGNKLVIRDYQLRCAYNILKERYCNIAVATSGGKTLIFSLVLLYLIHKHPDKKFLLVVPSKTLVTQFFDDLIEFNKNQLDINIQEVFGVGEKPRTMDETMPVNVCIGTFQSLVKYEKKWFKQFWSITADEGHKSGAVSYRKILKNTFCNAYYRWGMSGSFPKDDTAEMMKIMAHTGPVVDIVKAKELMDKGFITKVKIKGVLMYHNDWEFAETIQIVASRDRKACYDLEMAKAQESNEKIGVVNRIISETKGNTLVLFHNTEYGQKLLESIKDKHPDKVVHYIDGSINNKKRKAIKSDMELTDKQRVLVASFGTLSTGVSIKAISNVIFTQSFKKDQLIIQSIGRSLRLHKDKKFAYIFDLVDVFNTDSFAERTRNRFKNIMLTHWEKRLKIYAEEEYPVTTVDIDLRSAA